MNAKEQAAADALLEKIKDAATPGDALQYATAYNQLTQAYNNRVDAGDDATDDNPPQPAAAS